MLNVVPIWVATRLAYDCSWVLSLMPADWNPAVMLFPRATYRAKRDPAVGLGGISDSLSQPDNASNPEIRIHDRMAERVVIRTSPSQLSPQGGRGIHRVPS